MQSLKHNWLGSALFRPAWSRCVISLKSTRTFMMAGPYDCMANDDRLNTTTFPPSHYGCQEDGYCPNKQARTLARSLVRIGTTARRLPRSRLVGGHTEVVECKVP